MNYLGILGIIIALLVMLYLAYKGMSTIYLAPLMAAVVCITNGLPVISSLTGTYMDGFINIIKMLFPFFLLGSLLGRIYADTGAATVISNGILALSTSRAKTPKNKRLIAITVIILLTVILGYGGINTMVLLFTTYPIAISMAKELNIPRRYVPGIIFVGGGVAFCGPGAPQTANILAGKLLGTPSTSAMIPGLIGAAVVVVGSIVYLYLAVEKSIKNGETFEAKDTDNKAYNKTNVKQPGMLTSLIPLVIVFVTFLGFKTDVVLSLFLAIVTSLVLLSKYITIEGNSTFQKISKMLNSAINFAAPTILALAALSGFGSIVQATPQFGNISNALMSIPGPPLLVAGITVAIIVGLTSSPPAGLSIALMVFGPMFINDLGVNPEALHRVASFATSTFDSLPISGAVITALALAGVTHKEGYKPIMVTTVILTFLGMIVTAIICTLFPGLV